MYKTVSNPCSIVYIKLYAEKAQHMHFTGTIKTNPPCLSVSSCERMFIVSYSKDVGVCVRAQACPFVLNSCCEG